MSLQRYGRNLSWDNRAEDLTTLFSKYGAVEDAFVPTDCETGRPRGFGFVTLNEAPDPTERETGCPRGFTFVALNEAGDRHAIQELDDRELAVRPKRAGEVEGRDYFFVAKERFESWIAEDKLLEHALVYGEYKGIPRQQASGVDAALAAGTDVVLRIDVQGAATVKRLMPDCISIFVTADSEEVL
ncbi:Guanylate kinase, partial [Tetrabaena socialis]